MRRRKKMTVKRSKRRRELVNAQEAHQRKKILKRILYRLGKEKEILRRQQRARNEEDTVRIWPCAFISSTSSADNDDDDEIWPCTQTAR